MCAHAGGRVPARDYLGQAKRRAKHLQSLRSVSRAYRQQAVREIKARAIIEKEKTDVSRQGSEAVARDTTQAPGAAWDGRADPRYHAVIAYGVGDGADIVGRR